MQPTSPTTIAPTQPTTPPPSTIAPTPPAGSYQPASPVISADELAVAKKTLDTIGALFKTKLVGQDNLFLSLMVVLLANGHILMESVPGLAKTTAAQTLADTIKATFHRIQCTPDVLPSDIVGTEIYNYTKGTLETKVGPVYANFVLLDEINRSSAKTQSAMLEAMQERQITVGGQTYTLPVPFIALATQNPIEQEGTYILPEAQLDRFLLKEIISYPTAAEEVQILQRIESGVLDTKIDPKQAVDLKEVVAMQKLVKRVYVDDSVKNYIVNLVAATRNPGAYISAQLAQYVEFGASPRGSITLMQVAQAIAFINGRDYVTPDDVKALRYSVLRHRIVLNFEAVADNVHPEAIIDAIFAAVATP